MDIQLKRGLLEVCVLADLLDGDSYGYQLIKDISECVEISESTLYPILKRLEANEMLTVYSIEHNGRLRRYYSITAAGKEKLDVFKNEWIELIKVYEFICSKKGEGKNDKVGV